MTPRYPEFLCVGAQKAGTTWLAHMLTQHPSVWLPPTNEVHYFDAVYIDGASPKHPEKDRLAEWGRRKVLDAVEWTLQSKMPDPEKLARISLASLIALRDLTDAWYAKIFERVPVGRICGEVSPGYANLPEEGIEHIARLMPNVKCIFIMRDPIERSWSDLRMQMTIAKATNIDDILEYVATDRFFARNDYMTTIERYRKCLPVSSFLPLYFEDIERKPKEFLTTIYTFLDVDPGRARFKGVSEAIHEGPPTPITPAHYDLLKERLAPAYERLRALDTPTVDSWYRKHYQ